ncbi:MAG: T9SS type A sorting domain-containing protein [Bacteroidia bacterium]|nr:T9SS type A sorting domain-containing protein [Bacteroidia bacterium]
MRNRVIIILMLLFGGALQAQLPLMWQQIYGGTSIEKGYGVRSCLDQGYIAVGTSSMSGPTDGYIVRTDSIGLVMWAKFYGGVNIDIIRSVEILPDSGFIVAGYTNSYGHGGYDGWLMKIDKHGDTLWNKYVGGNDWDFFNDVATTSDSGFICVGSTFTNGNEDMYVVKFDKYGDTIWTRTYGGARIDQGHCIVQTEDTLYGIAGYTESYADTLGDSWILYTQQNGDTIWTRTLGYTAKNDIAYGIAYDSIVNTFFFCGSSTQNGNQSGYWSGLLYNGSNWNIYTFDLPNTEAYYKIISKHGLTLFACTGITNSSGSGGFDMAIFTSHNGWATNTQGTVEPDEAFDIDFTHDGGFILCGYTEGYGSLLPNLYLVKTDTLGVSTNFVGIEETSVLTPQTGRLSVFPNPADDNVNCVVTLNRSQDAQFLLYNSLGEIVFNLSIAENQFNEFNSTTVQLNTIGLPAGIYYCTVLTDNGTQNSEKLIIAR